MARTDIHRPAAIVPADYQFVAFDYLPSTGDIESSYLAEMRRQKIAHMGRTGGTYSDHEHGGQCYICGSVNAIYTATFYHPKSNAYIRTGLDCAEKLECRGIDAFKKNVKVAREAAAGKRKAKAALEVAGHGKAWDLFVAGTDGVNETIVRDIVGKLVKYGSISDKQMNFIGALLAKIAQAPVVAAARAAETEAAAIVPVTNDRILIEGVVVSVRAPDAYAAFPAWKMLVKHDTGYKVWGTIPSAISDVKPGARVSFVAAVSVSDKDNKFGFFSRPAQAKVLVEA
jgi:hypothetical protein